MYFALVVFKKAESVALLNDSKFLQTKVNKIARRSIGYMSNPFLAGEKNLMGDDDESEDDQMKEDRIEK